MKSRALTTLIAIALLAALSLVPSPNGARADLPSQEPDSTARDYRSDHPTARQASSDVLRYWTEERMAAAQPAPFDRTAPAVPAEPARELMAQADGAPMAVAGVNKFGVETGAVSINIPGGGTAPLPNFTYPFPYNYSYVQMAYVNDLIPYSTNGIVYFTQNGLDYVCSGTSVTSGGGSGNRSLILTAGHCLHNGDNNPASWSTNVIFKPAKLGASEPFGTWTESNLWVNNNWYAAGNDRYDYGFIVTDPTSNVCGAVGPCIGEQGLAWNQNPFHDFWVYGYPAVSPFTGDRLITCSATLARLDTWVGGTDLLPMGVGCNMTNGSSGGAWVIFGKTANVGYVNSVVTYKYTNPAQPDAIYGPYFASAFGSLWNSARVDVP